MPKLHIQFTLFSAFYSPLISTMTGNFLTEEGFDYEWSIAKPGTSALNALREGTAHVVQSTISQGFTSLERGEQPKSRHFALINNMDGFFLSEDKPTTTLAGLLLREQTLLYIMAVSQ
ncbi:MAG: hypothetical protein CM15mP100_0450 [Alphaproteobacteria bacterium]|nr:MAG: hypothetical protein CM15mP100_0450 [Alphaproteobacteria bacterium]